MPRLLLAVLFVLPANASGWEEVKRENGIVVYEKEAPGRDLATFRGVAKVDADLYQVLAVLADNDRRTEWQHRCIDARTIEHKGGFKRVAYNRTDAPWPADDRDVVLMTNVRVAKPGKLLFAEFRGISHRKMPKVDGVVRMPYLKGHYKLEWLSDTQTRVEYLVDADPGGWLPDWIANRASKELPFKTLTGLRKQVKRTKGVYDEKIAEWAAARAAKAAQAAEAGAGAGVSASPAMPTE